MTPVKPSAPFAIVIAVVIAGPWAGCAAPHSSTSTLESDRSLLVASRSPEADALWESACDVLREHGFRLDQVDRSAGVVTTNPRTSQQLFEFWRKDVRTSHDLLESSINPIRRWVEIRFVSDEQAWNKMAVTVHKERFSSPDRQFNSTGAAYQFFGDQLPVTTGALRVTPADERWLDMGRDGAMEDHLVRTILARSGAMDSAGPEASQNGTNPAAPLVPQPD